MSISLGIQLLPRKFRTYFSLSSFHSLFGIHHLRFGTPGLPAVHLMYSFDTTDECFTHGESVFSDISQVYEVLSGKIIHFSPPSLLTLSPTLFYASRSFKIPCIILCEIYNLHCGIATWKSCFQLFPTFAYLSEKLMKRQAMCNIFWTLTFFTRLLRHRKYTTRDRMS